ncbi:S-adenosyl-L-methionine-dependent methyltransferase [Daldinia loculata]|uniref:S-adenosyl-L-methionine-dependent methyltransferase n=1 Tax=Daldinia loculata TaxID=103429 RepID=UPI0020C431A6|nr:S-adenosyl-L-methionine-dependent methyltransferase [Daldinia loculata]KAI1652272.1 S-adenosyl-L-methionine-dependent methyltransferase [Daldinia loculata]
MSLTEELKGDYKEHARAYNEEYPMLPHGIMETQLLASALGDCTGYTVLDLGGGTGVRAREVIDLGATSVDVVDLSPDMLSAGRRTAEGAGAKYADNIGWHEGDVSKPLSHLPLRQTYDLVMANWVMDHAASLAELEAMWRNVAAYLAPGGRFVGVRSGDPYASCAAQGKYGIRYKDWRDVPGGVFFRYEVATVPPIDIVASSWEVTYSGSTEMMDKVGLGEVETEPYENAEVVKKDLGFWELFLENPSMAVVKARKLARA